MFDAISNFVVYLRDCIDNSEDPEEVTRLQSVLDKAEMIKAKLDHAVAQQVEA